MNNKTQISSEWKYIAAPVKSLSVNVQVYRLTMLKHWPSWPCSTQRPSFRIRAFYDAPLWYLHVGVSQPVIVWNEKLCLHISTLLLSNPNQVALCTKTTF